MEQPVAGRVQHLRQQHQRQIVRHQRDQAPAQGREGNTKLQQAHGVMPREQSVHDQKQQHLGDDAERPQPAGSCEVVAMQAGIEGIEGVIRAVADELQGADQQKGQHRRPGHDTRHALPALVGQLGRARQQQGVGQQQGQQHQHQLRKERHAPCLQQQRSEQYHGNEAKRPP